MKILVSTVLLLITLTGVAQFQLKKTLIAHAGSKSKSDTYELVANFNQQSSDEQLQSANFQLQSGFWTENLDLIYKNGLE